MRPKLLLPVLAALTAVSTPAVARAADCVPLPTTKAFDQVDGDRADYSVAPGGGFEFGGQPWTLTGAARIVAGNETLGVKPGWRSLRLPLGSTATSPEFCVDNTKPHFRFAYKVDNAWLSGVLALVIYRDEQGEVTSVELTSSKRVEAHPTLWQASDPSPLSTLLPLDKTGGAATVQIKFLSLIPADIIDQLWVRFTGTNPFPDALNRAQIAYEKALAATWSPFFNIGVTVDSVMVDPYRRG